VRATSRLGHGGIGHRRLARMPRTELISAPADLARFLMAVVSE
jgi:hypothetical protein